MEKEKAIDLSEAKCWFDKKLFGKLADKLFSKAKHFKPRPGKEYSLQDILRYCATDDKLVTATEPMQINCTDFFKQLTVEEYTFEFSRYEKRNLRVYYKLLENNKNNPK